MKEEHLMSNALSGAAAAVVVLGLCSTAATATEPCDDFSECKVLIEINSTDGDIGFHFLRDGGDLISALIRDPNFVTIFEDSASGALLEQKLTETFAESAEPFCKDALKEEEDDEVVTLEEFLMRWTPGTYRFEGFGDDPIPEFGFREGTTELTYHLPAAPTDLDFDGSVISWDSGDDLGECATKDQLNVLVMGGVLPTHPEDVVVDAWEVVFEPDVEDGDPLGQLKFTIRVSGDLDDFAPLAVTVPKEYLDSLPDDTLVKIEVGAIGGEDNATFTEIFDICVNEAKGCDGDVVPDAPTFSCIGFEPPMDRGPVKVKKNRVLPLKGQLLDENSQPINDLDISAPPLIQIIFDSEIPTDSVDVTSQALSAGAGIDGNQFEFLDSKWQFNLKTKNYSAAGTYTITMVSGDTDEYLVDPTCTASFVIKRFARPIRTRKIR